MTIQISHAAGDAALRAAAKSGYEDLVKELLNAGVKASSLGGIAATIADYYGHGDVAEILRTAISREEKEEPGEPTPISDEVADAALRAASRSGYKELVEELLSVGVKASSMRGIAVAMADYYGHADVAEVLRTAISREEQAAPQPSP